MAAGEAIDHSGLDIDKEAEQIGCMIGVGIGGMEIIVVQDNKFIFLHLQDLILCLIKHFLLLLFLYLLEYLPILLYHQILHMFFHSRVAYFY